MFHYHLDIHKFFGFIFSSMKLTLQLGKSLVEILQCFMG